MKFVKSLLVAGACLGAFGAANAVVLANPGTCSVATINPDAAACLGTFSGNNVGNATTLENVLDTINNAWGTYFPSGVVSEGTTDAGAGAAGPFAAFNQELKSGSIFLDTPETGYFVVALKYGTNFDFFLLNGGAQGVSEIAFGSPNLAKGLSHATLYTGVAAPIPEPETYALMLAGLGALGFMARRRKQG